MLYRVMGSALHFNGKLYAADTTVEIAAEVDAKPLLDVGRIEPTEDKPKPDPKPGKAPSK